MSEWKEYIIEDLIRDKIISVGDGYRAKNIELGRAGIPFARAGNIDNGFTFEKADFFPIENLHKVGNKKSKVGDIVFTSKGTVGRFAFVTEEDQEFVYSPQLCYWRSHNQSTLNSRFLYYWMHSRGFLDQVHSVKGQTDMADYVSLTDQRKMKISIPAIDDQLAISSTLSSLDDKIDLLHRQNKTLEAMAETLFRQWFVEEAEESWEEVNLYDIAEHVKDNVNPSKNPEKAYQHYSLPAFDDGKTPRIEIGREILSNKYKISNGTLLVSKLNPRTPRIWMIGDKVSEGNAICSTEFQVIKPKNSAWKGYLYCFLKSSPVTQELAGASGGTSGSHQRVNPADIFNLTVLKPSMNKITNFDNITSDFWSKIQLNLNQIQILIQQRDTLLPRLMTGEISLKM